jgi:hypothetical protein
MRRPLFAILLGTFAASVSFSQIVGPLRTGFAVITPITGGSSAFSVSETFTEIFDGKLVQSSVSPSPLVTLTNMVVNLDPVAGVNTGIAIVDPFDVTATVALSLVNQRGVIIDSRTILVGARQQRSQFVTQFFSSVPELRTSFTGQLFISSNVPIAILGLAFTGPFFTALPTPTQLSGNNVFPGPVVPTTATTAFNPFPGVGVMLFPQFATGGGWASKITIANTSALPQSVRVDVFDSTGRLFTLPIAFSVPNTIIQPGGVVTFSTAR